MYVSTQIIHQSIQEETIKGPRLCTLPYAKTQVADTNQHTHTQASETSTSSYYTVVMSVVLYYKHYVVEMLMFPQVVVWR